MELQVTYTANGGKQVLKTNFDDVKEFVKTELKKYEMEVTEETVKEAKDVMAKLNKVKGEVGETYKLYIDDLSSPINQLKNEKKELEAIITQGRQDIADQVSKFEQKRLDEIRLIIMECRDEICQSKFISPTAVTIDDLVKLTAITSSKTVSKATREAIEARVQQVENEMLRAKIEAEEKAKRDREIAEKARLEAEERAREREAQMQARFEREKSEALAKAEREKQEAINNAQPKKEAPKQAEDGSMIYTVVATFEINAAKGIAHEKIVNKLDSIFGKAGITSCINIEVMND